MLVSALLKSSATERASCNAQSSFCLCARAASAPEGPAATAAGAATFGATGLATENGRVTRMLLEQLKQTNVLRGGRAKLNDKQSRQPALEKELQRRRLGWRRQVQKVLGGIAVLRRPDYSEVSVVLFDSRSEGTDGRPIGPQHLPVDMDQQTGPVGILEYKFLFDGRFWRRGGWRGLVQARRLLLDRRVSQFRKARARFLQELQNQIRLPFADDFIAVSYKWRHGATGDAEFHSRCASAGQGTQKLCQGRPALLIPNGRKHFLAGIAVHLKNTARGLVAPANSAILLQKHCRPRSLFENKIRFTPHYQDQG